MSTVCHTKAERQRTTAAERKARRLAVRAERRITAAQLTAIRDAGYDVAA